MKIALWIPGLAAAATLLSVWMQLPKLYSAAELTNLVIRKNTLHFEVDPGSRFYPLLIKTKIVNDQLEISIYKQLKLSPMRGIMYTPPPGVFMLDFQKPQTVVDQELSANGVANLKFILRAADGKFPVSAAAP